MEKKKLIYAELVFIVSFAITYVLIKNYKKSQNTIENIKVK